MGTTTLTVPEDPSGAYRLRYVVTDDAADLTATSGEKLLVRFADGHELELAATAEAAEVDRVEIVATLAPSFGDRVGVGRFWAEFDLGGETFTTTPRTFRLRPREDA